MTVQITDKRGKNHKPAPRPEQQQQPETPGWWPELVAVDQELAAVCGLHGEPSEQGNTFDIFGNPLFAANAVEFKRQNDARKAAGKAGQWAKIILEEVYEALEIAPDDIESVARLYNELIQAAAMCLAAAEDLRVTHE